MKDAGTILGVYTAGRVGASVIAGPVHAARAAQGGALESLVSLIMQALREVKRRFEDITLIGVCTGPGSFTGLRIGVSFARSLAQARDIPIVGVSSYDVVSFGAGSYQMVSAVSGKPGFYYARILESPEMPPRFVAGTRDVIEQAARELRSGTATILGLENSGAKPAEAALAVAELARQAFEKGAPRHWTDVIIDYGQRPNAVVNWERRQSLAAEGHELLGREPGTQ